MKLTEDAEPVATMMADEFRDQVEDGMFWGVPIEYFTIEHGRVKLDSRLASKMKWNRDATGPNHVNINALAQRVTIDGNELSINPGFFCSDVKKSEIKQDN